ncbi:MAG: APC family permease [Caulobacteraceae bacterium]
MSSGRPASGRPPVLARTMDGFGALLITLSGLSPSIGVFIVGSDVMHQAGSSTLLCFAAAALLGVAIANVYAELSAAFPETGGEYTIVGRALGPAWGFAMLGLNLLTFSIAPAMTGLGVATYLQVVTPGLPAVPTALVAVALCMGVAVLNVKVNAWVTGLFLSVELVSLAVVAALGLSHPQRAVVAMVAHPVLLAHGQLVPVSLAGLGIGAAAAIYAFDGYGSVVYLGEELQDAPKRIARVVFWALGLAVVWQLIPIAAVLVGAPSLQTLFAAESPVPAFIAAVGGPTLSKVMSLGVALALFNAMIASALMGGRQLYSSGRDRAWGRLSGALAQLHPRFNSPWVATLTVGVASLALCLVKLNVLVILIGDGTAGLYICMCLAALQGRRTGVTAHAAYRMPLFPLLPWLALAALLAVGVADLFDADGRKGVAASAVVVTLSALYYRFVLKPRGVWAHRGPQAGG